MAATTTKQTSATKATTTKRPSATKATTRKRSSATKATKTSRRPVAARSAKPAVTRTTELSEGVLQSVEDGQRAAIDAVQRFVDTVDRALPALPRGEGSSRRREIVDAALDMADRLVHTQYEFLRKVVDDAGVSLGGRSAKK